MRGFAWRLVQWVALALEPEEREAALGDFEEHSVAAWRALADVTGLVVRRQAALWTSWRPWAALLGVVGPMGLLLLQFSLATGGAINFLAWVYRNDAYIDRGLLGATGFNLWSMASALSSYALASRGRAAS